MFKYYYYYYQFDLKKYNGEQLKKYISFNN